MTVSRPTISALPMTFPFEFVVTPTIAAGANGA